MWPRSSHQSPSAVLSNVSSRKNRGVVSSVAVLGVWSAGTVGIIAVLAGRWFGRFLLVFARREVVTHPACQSGLQFREILRREFARRYKR